MSSVNSSFIHLAAGEMKLFDPGENPWIIEPDSIISPHSRFEDAIWDFNNGENRRLQIYSRGRLLIDWGRLQKQARLSNQLILELKIFAFLWNFFGSYLGGLSQPPHPAHLCHSITTLGKFFGQICHSLDQNMAISSVSDISASDLRPSLAGKSAVQRHILLPCLSRMASPLVIEVLPFKRLRWNRVDIQNLMTTEERDSHKRLPDELFRLLTVTAADHIKQSLLSLGFNPEDDEQMASSTFLPLGEENLQRYSDWIKKLGVETARRPRKKYAVSPELMSAISAIDSAVTSAKIILLAFTGGRYSEIAGLRRNGLRQEAGGFYLYGTVIKWRGLSAPTEQDRWVAIPIVRDAVKLLEIIATAKHSEFLFPSPADASKHESNTAFNAPLTSYLRNISQDSEWSQENIYAMRFRHSLVHYFYQAKLNLPYISQVLHHRSDPRLSLPNKVTMGYGAIGREAPAIAVERAREKASPVVDPQQYFVGMALQPGQEGWLDRLLDQGVILLDLGFGYFQLPPCLPSADVQAIPRCIQRLECRPLTCPHFDLSAANLAAWEARLLALREFMPDPEVANVIEPLQQAITENEALLALIQKETIV